VAAAKAPAVARKPRRLIVQEQQDLAQFLWVCIVIPPKM